MTTEVNITAVPCQGKIVKIYREMQNSTGAWERVVLPEPGVLGNPKDTYRNHVWNTFQGQRLVVEEADLPKEPLTPKAT